MSLLCSGKPATPRFSFFAASAIFLLLNSILLPASWAAPKVVLISLDGATPRIVNGFLQSGVLPRQRGSVSCAVKVFLPSRTSSSLLRSPLPATLRSRPGRRLRATTLDPILSILWPVPLPATSAVFPRPSAAIRLTVQPRVRIPRHFPSGIRFARLARRW